MPSLNGARGERLKQDPYSRFNLRMALLPGYMRILHVLPSLDQSYGGPLRAVLDLSAHSESARFHSEILGFGPLRVPDNPVHRELIHELPLSFPRSYCFSRELSQWLRNHLSRYDGVVLHAMWLYPNWVISRACRLQCKPYIHFPHGMLEPWPVFGQGSVKAIKKVVYWKLIEREIFGGANHVLFTTNRELQLARGTFALPDVPLSVIPYGVSFGPGTVDQPSDKSLLLPPDENIALFLGRVHPKKNLRFLIEAWADAQPDPSWRLVIAGPGHASYVSELQDFAKTLGTGDKVKFIGMVTGANKSYLLRHAKWFLLPSFQENFGNAVLEAIQHGCPTAISDQVYLSEFFHKSAEVLPLRHEAWVAFIRNRMTDERYRRQLIEADEGLRRQFDIANLSKRWSETLTEIFSFG